MQALKSIGDAEGASVAGAVVAGAVVAGAVVAGAVVAAPPQAATRMEAAAIDASSPRDVRKDSPPFALSARRGRKPAGSRGASLGIAARRGGADDQGPEIRFEWSMHGPQVRVQ